MVIETKRLILREMTYDDFNALYQVLADTDIMRYYPYTFDENRVKNWIERNIERYRILGFGLWSVCFKETGEVIGDCGLTMQLINGQIKPEIGYHIRADKQRKGFAKEAAIAVRDWTFNNTPFNMVYSYMSHLNKPSAKTAVAYGCKQVDEFFDDENEITKVFAISKDEWINR
ncbi:MAG: GNAT family N-acetyltransferase [Oscillospiraceae bacterium]|nr:GNAT family N-acetyltransferase [Oscillospiraceae bacterium]